MAEPFMIKKAVDLSASALGKATSVVIKGLLVIAVIAGIGWGIYVTRLNPILILLLHKGQIQL